MSLGRWIGYGVIAVVGLYIASFVGIFAAAAHTDYGAIYHQCVGVFGTGSGPENAGRLACSFADMVIPTSPMVALVVFAAIALCTVWFVHTWIIRPRQSSFSGGGINMTIYPDKRYLTLREPGSVEPLIIDYGTMLARIEPEIRSTTHTVYAPTTLTGVSGGSTVLLNQGGAYDVAKHRKTGKARVMVGVVTRDRYAALMAQSDGVATISPQWFDAQHQWMMPARQANAFMRWFKSHQSAMGFNERAMKTDWTARVNAALATTRAQFDVSSKDLLEVFRMTDACTVNEYIGMDAQGRVAVLSSGFRWTFEPKDLVLSGDNIRCPRTDGPVYSHTALALSQDMLRRLDRVRRTTR